MEDAVRMRMQLALHEAWTETGIKNVTYGGVTVEDFKDDDNIQAIPIEPEKEYVFYDIRLDDLFVLKHEYEYLIDQMSRSCSLDYMYLGEL